MTASRSGPKGAFASFGLAALVFVLVPTDVGPQDIAARAAHAAVAPERPRPAFASPFGTIHASTFSFPRPIGTEIPEPRIQLASLGVVGLDVTRSTGERTGGGRGESTSVAPVSFPTVNRALKGDLLGPRPQPDPTVETETAARHLPDLADEIEAAARFVPFPEYDISMSLEMHPQV